MASINEMINYANYMSKMKSSGLSEAIGQGLQSWIKQKTEDNQRKKLLDWVKKGGDYKAKMQFKIGDSGKVTISPKDDNERKWKPYIEQEEYYDDENRKRYRYIWIDPNTGERKVIKKDLKQYYDRDDNFESISQPQNLPRKNSKFKESNFIEGYSPGIFRMGAGAGYEKAVEQYGEPMTKQMVSWMQKAQRKGRTMEWIYNALKSKGLDPEAFLGYSEYKR